MVLWQENFHCWILDVVMLGRGVLGEVYDTSESWCIFGLGGRIVE